MPIPWSSNRHTKMRAQTTRPRITSEIPLPLSSQGSGFDGDIKNLNSTKVHSNFLSRTINIWLLKWKLQRTRDKAFQIISLLYIFLMMSSVGRLLRRERRDPFSPRILALSHHDDYYTQVHRKTVHEYKHKNHRHRHRKVPDLRSNKRHKPDRSFENDFLEEGNCKAMHDWQLQSYPACNNIHEFDLTQAKMGNSRLINNGGFREVWLVKEKELEPHDSYSSAVVMKTLLFKKKFRHREFDRHRRDANAYSMLHSSIHIPDIYGYCTNTAIFDLAPNGTLKDMIHDPDKTEMSQWTPNHKLRYAWQVSKALADVHSVGNVHGSPSISHTDISTDQFLWVDSMFKLNDYNRARFIRWNAVEGKPCKFIIEKSPGRNRSPEEYLKKMPLNEKIDVYSLGNVLYSILAQEEVFSSLENTIVQGMVRNGTTPSIPFVTKKTFGEKETAILSAMQMCHVFDEKERSSAAAVEEFLREKLQEYHVEKF